VAHTDLDHLLEVHVMSAGIPETLRGIFKNKSAFTCEGGFLPLPEEENIIKTQYTELAMA
jgi:hypothetical protein